LQSDQVPTKGVGTLYAIRFLTSNGKPMTKILEQIDEVIRNPKHPFRQVADRPEKPQKHRYERRKVREFMKSGDWLSEK
jgi:hypothetical protein